MQAAALKPAFQKDAALLAAIEAARASGRRSLFWLGQSGFLALHAGKCVMFDPYLSDSLTVKYAVTDKPHTRLTERVIDPGLLICIDVITASHVHTDHLDAETLLPLLAANPSAMLVAPMAIRAAVCARLAAAGQIARRLTLLIEDMPASIAGLRIHAIPAAHNTVDRDAAGHPVYIGFVVEWGGWTIYHSGDTLLHPGLVPALLGFSIDVALLPINGNLPERRVAGNLDGAEAAQLAKNIGAGLVIPCHYDMFGFNTAAPDIFVAECARLGQPCRVLRNGEGQTL